MTISVIICTADRPDTLRAAIVSVINNQPPPLELIIVDQSRTQTSRQITKSVADGSSVSIRYIHDQGSGLARARNIGWRVTSGEIIAFTDDDARVDATWVKAILESFSNRRFHTGVTGGKVIPVYEEKNLAWEIPSQWQYLLPALDHGNKLMTYRNGSLPPGVNYAILKKILWEVGGFNERLGVNTKRRFQITGEDSDMSLKTQALGYDLVYNPHMICYHPVPLRRQTPRYLFHRLTIEGYTDEYLYLLHHRIPLFRKISRFNRKSRELAKLTLCATKEPTLENLGNRARSWGYWLCLCRYLLISPKTLS